MQVLFYQESEVVFQFGPYYTAVDFCLVKTTFLACLIYTFLVVGIGVGWKQ